LKVAISLIKTAKYKQLGENADLKPLKPYRFFPIYFQIILRSFGTQLYGLALPNYLIFQTDFSASLIGIIFSIFTIAYIFGPIAARPITEKIGIKKSLIIAAILPPMLIVIQLLYFVPSIIIICRAFEGLSLGLFWPNVQMQVSKWQHDCSEKKGQQLFTIYGFSWNFGCLLGGIAGFVFVFFTNNDYLGLILALFIIFSIIPFSLLGEADNRTLFTKEGKIYSIERALIIESNKNIMAEPVTKQNESDLKSSISVLLSIPILVAVTVQFIHATFRSMFLFTFPFHLYQLGWDSYWTYFMLLIQQIMQMISITMSGSISPKAKYNSLLLGMFTCLSFTVAMIFIRNMAGILIIMICLGFFNGFIYAFGAQVMMTHGKATGSLKYATYYEIFSGIGYGITPFIGGFLAEINLNLNYQYVFIAGAICLIYFLFACRNKLR
jgi:MFS family permease